MAPLSGSFHPTDEVDELRWVPVEDAPEVLTHDTDREVLRAAVPA
jgi:8-oxo-dGTP diphosphatase